MAKVVNAIFTTFLSKSIPTLVSVENSDSEKFITMEEVSKHDSLKDCWIIIYDRVYNVTDFIDEHPGGADLFLEYAGMEASGAFRGAGHSVEAIKSLEKYYIGELPIHERIFRKPDGLKLCDIPE